MCSAGKKRFQVVILIGDAKIYGLQDLFSSGITFQFSGEHYYESETPKTLAGEINEKKTKLLQAS